MKEIHAISGIFIDGDKVLLLKRSPNRSHGANKWDLMGGDIEAGKSPFETLTNDAADKLHIPTLTVVQEGDILITEGTTVPIKRHYFVCKGDYRSLTVSPNKYDHFGWYDKDEVKSLELCPGVATILKKTEFLKEEST